MVTALRALHPFLRWSSLRSSLLRSSLAAVILGCGGAERPPPAGDGASPLIVERSAGYDGTCTPREVRECRVYYQDDNGTWHCPTSDQFCQLDGNDWTPCGEYVLDSSGDLVRR